MRRIIILMIILISPVLMTFANNNLPTPFSIQMHSLGAPFEYHKRAIDAVVALGAKQVRDELFWHQVEKSRGVLSIPEVYLQNLNYSLKQGIDTLIILDYGNELYDGGLAPYTDEGRTAFARYAEFLARELKGKVRYFEVWNEPNVDGFWKPQKNPENYVRLLQAVYPVIKRVNPEAVVVGVSLSTLDLEFLQAVIEKGALDYLDVLSLHPYCAPQSPEEKQIFPALLKIIEQIWLTEIGWPTNVGGGVSELRQAELLARTYLLALAITDIQTTFWYWLGPDGEKEWWAEDRFGILHQDWTPKPAYIAYQQLIKTLQGAEFMAQFQPVEKTYVLQFRKDGELIYALWAEDVVKHLVIKQAPTTIKVTFLNGEEMLLQSKEGQIFIDAHAMPVFLMTPQTLKFAGSRAPVELILSKPEAIARGEKVEFKRKFSKRAFSNTKSTLRALPFYEEEWITQSTPSEIFIPPAAAEGTLSMLHCVYESSASLPFALLVAPIKIIEPVKIRLTPLPLVGGLKFLRLDITNTTSQELNGEVIINTPANEQIQPQTISFANLHPGKTLRQILNIYDTRELDYLYKFKMVVNLTNGVNVTYDSPILAFYQSLYTSRPLQIDGNLADWNSDTQPIKINRKENIVFGFTDWDGEKDVSARIYTAWDKTHFYLAAEVEDTKLSFPCSGFHIYNNDGLEVYFDVDHDGDAEILSYNQDDFQYAVSLSEEKEMVWCYQLGRPSKKSLAIINTNPTQAETLSGKQFTGYILEMAIPLKELRLKPDSGKLIGFNVAVNDDDDPESLNPFVQELQLSWTGMKNAYQNTGAFADLFFVRAEKLKSDKNTRTADGKLLTESAKYWLKKLAEFQQQNRTEFANTSGGIILLGDSLTERFPVQELLPDLPIINRGIGGNKIGGWKYYGLIDRLDVSVYALKPRKLFIQIGINDIVYAHTPTRIMKKGYENLLAELKRNCPQSGIYVQSLLPVRGKWSKYNKQIVNFNREIESLCRKYGFTYINLYPQFADENGELKAEFSQDDLHLTPAGYNQWHAILKPFLN